MSRVLVSGSLAYDRIMNFNGIFADHIIPEKIHSVNLSFFVPELVETFGGCSGNIAYNLALLGNEAVILSRGGKDFAPYEKWLREKGVDTSLIEHDEASITSVAHIITDTKDNQIAAFHPGAGMVPFNLSRVPRTADFAIVGPGNPDDMRAFPKLFRETGIKFAFDPGQQIPTLSSDDLINGMEGSEAVLSNDYELELIMKKTGLDEAEIVSKTRMLITTYGENGSRIMTHEGSEKVEAAKPKNAEDPTGAGDAYRAGFVHGLIRGWGPSKSARFAGVVACYTVEALGTQTHSYTESDVAARYKENFGETL